MSKEQSLTPIPVFSSRDVKFKRVISQIRAVEVVTQTHIMNDHDVMQSFTEVGRKASCRPEPLTRHLARVTERGVAFVGRCRITEHVLCQHLLVHDSCPRYTPYNIGAYMKLLYCNSGSTLVRVSAVGPRTP